MKSVSDRAREARQCFEMISFVCALAFGMPLALVLIKIASELFSGPSGALPYSRLAIPTDVWYAAILGALILVPTLASYVYYRRHAAE